LNNIFHLSGLVTGIENDEGVNFINKLRANILSPKKTQRVYRKSAKFSVQKNILAQKSC